MPLVPLKETSVTRLPLGVSWKTVPSPQGPTPLVTPPHAVVPYKFPSRP